MTKSSIISRLTLAGSLAFLLSTSSAVLAQTSAPAATSQTPAPSKPAAGAQGSTAAKPSAAGSAKRPAGSAAPAAPKTVKERASYALGMNIGKGMQQDGVDIDVSNFARGLRDALSGAKPAITDEEAQTAVMAVAKEVRAKQQAKLAAVAAANQQQGDAFLAANKMKDGVVTLPSGLQYKILKAGTGPKPAASDKVVCNYRGTFLNGEEFDSSYKRGEPVTFPLADVIKGWSEALQLMPVGSKWELFVPADLAYGDRGMGREIGPKSTLIFDVELLSIAPKDATPAPDAAKPADAKPNSK
ncbi:MAG TPA: FKBP-type peptidyl-prolyl cis-trans isomerase [Dongiaceae bacterium]|nr:FKBP-type peptidyl-prolyl cis-trans isomerase [Dongiaceae bacterium]